MKLTIKETVEFGMLGALMYASKFIMEVIPNIHLLGVFTITFTVVYGKKALYPIYTCVFLLGIFNGFATWWIPHLYLWAVLWGIIILIPKKMSKKTSVVVYIIVNALHGFLYGTLYAPAQAVLFGLDFKGTIAWIIAGIPFDVIHGISNFFCGMLIVPLINLLNRLEQDRSR